MDDFDIIIIIIFICILIFTTFILIDNASRQQKVFLTNRFHFRNKLISS